MMALDSLDEVLKDIKVGATKSLTDIIEAENFIEALPKSVVEVNNHTVRNSNFPPAFGDNKMYQTTVPSRSNFVKMMAPSK